MNTKEIKEIKKHLSACNDGDHDLMTIYAEEPENGMGVSVKWCKKCGSVVADGLSDGRTYPGRFVSMIGPGLYMKFKNE